MTNPNCGMCGNLNVRGFCNLTACSFPSNKTETIQVKKPTNADRIRAMTDEELATFLYEFGDCPCFGVKFCERGTRCEDAVLMKLREPVDNGACSADETSEKVQDE